MSGLVLKSGEKMQIYFEFNGLLTLNRFRGTFSPPVFPQLAFGFVGGFYFSGIWFVGLGIC